MSDVEVKEHGEKAEGAREEEGVMKRILVEQHGEAEDEAQARREAEVERKEDEETQLQVSFFPWFIVASF